MKKTVNEAYPKRTFPSKNNGGKSKRYIKTYVKRLTSASDAAQPNDAATDPSVPAVKPKEIIQVTLKNIGSDDAQQIKDTLIPNAKVFMSDAKSKTGASFKVPTMTFTIPDAKFAKWIKSMLPKIETILSSILSKKHNAKIKIKVVDSEDVNDEQGRDNHRTSRNDINARTGN